MTEAMQMRVQQAAALLQERVVDEWGITQQIRIHHDEEERDVLKLEEDDKTCGIYINYSWFRILLLLLLLRLRLLGLFRALKLDKRRPGLAQILPMLALDSSPVSRLYSPPSHEQSS